MASSKPHPDAQAVLREQSSRLRQQLEETRNHMKATTAFTKRQEATLKRIRAELAIHNPGKTKLPQGRVLQEQSLHNIAEPGEYQIPAELSKCISQFGAKLQDVLPAITVLMAQQSGIQAIAKNGEASYQDLFDELQRMTQQRDQFRSDHLAAAKKNVILSMERSKAKAELTKLQNENGILRKQRNILQGRLDVLEDQGIDIGQPRNGLEAEARDWRRRYRDKRVKLDAAEDSDFPMAAEAGFDATSESGFDSVEDFFQSARLETELQTATDEMEKGEIWEDPETQNEPDADSPKEPESIETLLPKNSSAENDVEDPSQQAAQQDEQPDPQLVDQGTQPTPNLMNFNTEWVYGDDNSEDKIDWTSGEFDVHGLSDDPDGNGTVYEVDDTLYEDSDLFYEDDPAPPSSSADLPHFVSKQEYEDQLAHQQEECERLTKERDDAVADLEQKIRELAEKKAERKGAHQRASLLEEEMAEYQTRERKLKAEIENHELTGLQLREELRLQREEDPLADKLFIELHELRRKYEEAAEQRDEAKDRLKLLQQEMYKADVRRGEDLERLKYLEITLSKHNDVVEGLQNHTNAVLSIKDDEIRRLSSEVAATQEDSQKSLEARLSVREEEVQRINADLVVTKSELREAQSAVNIYLNKITAAKSERDVAKGKAKKVAAELKDAVKERDLARDEAKKFQDEYERVFQELVIKREIVKRVELETRFSDIFGATNDPTASDEEEDEDFATAADEAKDNLEDGVFLKHKASRNEEQIQDLFARTDQYAAGFAKSTATTATKTEVGHANATQEIELLKDQRDSALLDLSKVTIDLASARQALCRAQTDLGHTIVESNRAQGSLETASAIQGQYLEVARKDLDRIRTERDKLRSSLTAMIEERDLALQECADVSPQLAVQTQKADEYRQTVEALTRDIEHHVTTQESLRSRIRDLESARNLALSSPQVLGGLAHWQHEQSARRHSSARGGGSMDFNPQSTTPKSLNEALKDRSLYDVIDMGQQAVPNQTTSAAAAAGTPATQVVAELIQKASYPAIRRSERATRNPAPVYIAPTSPTAPSVPTKSKPSRKRKAAIPVTEDGAEKTAPASQAVSKRGKKRKAPSDPLYVAPPSPASPTSDIKNIERKPVLSEKYAPITPPASAVSKQGRRKKPLDPTYVAPISSLSLDVPQQDRKRKAATSGTEGPAKKK